MSTSVLFFLWSIQLSAQSIIINEVSQGTAGSQEYVEFLVTAPDLVNCNDTPPCIDLRGWVFDDNNGNLNTGGPQSGVGIASGACRFSNDPFWACIPAGTIILIYNDADPNSGLPADDIDMSDGNCALSIPISSGLFEHHPSQPSSTDATYATTGWIAGGNWTNISMANGGDGFQIYDAANLNNPVFSVGWNDNDLAQIFFGTSSLSGDVIYATDCNYGSQASWVIGSASTDQTPGAPNNATQANCIGNMNANCNPPQITFTTTPESCLGACDATASATVTGGTSPFVLSWSPAPGSGQGTLNAGGLCAGNYTFTLTDDNGTGCLLDTIIPITAGPACCLITNMTANVGACNPVPGDYQTTGVVEFTAPPATGQLIVEDCNGNQQVFNPPFTSPTNYTITGQNPDGAACDFTAYFTDDLACTQTIPYVAPTCPCNIDVFNANIGLCDQNTDTYTMSGDVSFTSPLASGSLIVEVNNGTTIYDTIINLPAISPQNWSISGIPSDGSASTVTVYFSADPGCSSTINYTAPTSCACNADLGTFTETVTGGTTNNSVLCFGDQISITSNGDWTGPTEQFSPPGPTYDPGVSWLMYSCPPTVGLTPQAGVDITTDPCFLGLVSDNDLNDINDLGWINAYPPGTFTNNTIYWVPVTMYSQVDGTYSYVNGTIPCYELGAPYPVQYLPEFTSSDTEDCLAGTAAITVNGGMPAIDGSSFTASNLQPATASFVNTTAIDGGIITISGLQGGDMWSFDITDDNGCPYTVSGGPFPPLEDPGFNYAQTSWCTTEAAMTPTITGIAGGTFSATPAGISLNTTTGEITPATSTPGTYNVTYTTPGLCFDDSTITVNIATTPAVDPVADQTVCAGDDFTLIDFTGAAGSTFDWTNDNTNIGLAAFGTGDIASFAGTAPTVQEVATITVTPTAGSCTGTPETFTLTVNPQDDPSFNYAQTSWCTTEAPMTPTITGTGSGTFTATPAGLSLNASTGEITPATSTPGVYDVTYTTSGACPNTQTTAVNVATTPSVNPVADQTICDGDNFTLIDFTGAAGSTFNWTNDNTNIGLAASGTGDISAFSGTASSVQEVAIITVTPTAGSCTGTPETFTLTVNPKDDPSFNYAQTSWCTSAAAMAVNINGTSGGTFTSTPAGLSINATSGEITPATSAPGTYSVTYNLTGVCPADSTVSITINETPMVDFGSAASGCEPLEVEFTNLTTTLGQLCQWDFGDGNTATGCGTVYNTYYAGDYDVSLTVTTAAGCTSSNTYTDFVSVSATPVASFDYSPNEIDVYDTEVDFDNTSIDASSYLWNFGDNSSTSTVESPSHIFPEEPGNYTVTLTAFSYNGVCQDSIAQTLTITEDVIFYVPNVVTPDGDQFNEVFQPVFTAGYDPFDFHLMIFNRWGEVVFESYNADKGWNGHYGDGGLVQDGVYVWQIEFRESMSDKRHTVRGHVTVLK